MKSASESCRAGCSSQSRTVPRDHACEILPTYARGCLLTSALGTRKSPCPVPVPASSFGSLARGLSIRLPSRKRLIGGPAENVSCATCAMRCYCPPHVQVSPLAQTQARSRCRAQSARPRQESERCACESERRLELL